LNEQKSHKKYYVITLLKQCSKPFEIQTKYAATIIKTRMEYGLRPAKALYLLSSKPLFHGFMAC